jgi:SAM-dependent methyltransferase
VARLFRTLRHRAEQPEKMDDFSQGGSELREALRHLRRLNRIFGAAPPTLYGVRRLWSEAGRPKRLSILDVGAGSGDVNRLLLRWADANRIDLQIVLADVTEEACEEARRLFRGERRVRVMRSDLFALPDACADVVTGTQFVHHFGADRLPGAVRRMLQISRLGVVINDIHRHWIPWAAVWLATRLVSGNRYIRSDGPLSVAKGFRARDWDELGQALGIAGKIFYAWRPWFRYVVVVRKSRADFGLRS